MVRHIFPTLALAALLAGGGALTGCSQEHTHGGNGRVAAPADDRAVVSWPSLTELDDLIHEADHLVLDSQFAELRALTPEIVERARTVATEPPPINVHNPQQVGVFQTELASLIEEIENPDEVDDDLLLSIMGGIIAITEELMDTAGVPHVHHHDLGEHYDHDHDHDHDHDEDGHHHGDGHDHEH